MNSINYICKNRVNFFQDVTDLCVGMCLCLRRAGVCVVCGAFGGVCAFGVLGCVWYVVPSAVFVPSARVCACGVCGAGVSPRQFWTTVC